MNRENVNKLRFPCLSFLLRLYWGGYDRKEEIIWQKVKVVSIRWICVRGRY